MRLTKASAMPSPKKEASLVATTNWQNQTIEGVKINRIFTGLPLDEGEEYPAGLEPSLIKAVNKSKASAGQDIILFIGATGAGKSTTINYLLGHNFVDSEAPNGNPCLSIVEGSHIPEALMGSADESCTMYPESFLGLRSKDKSKPSIYFCDCPGFADTRPIGKVITALSTDMVVKSARSVKGMVIVIEDG
ncbi:MAG TPA: hypothetical protein VD770_02490, partial [Coxiellaceae bacterium]|nr:hypothetical protein [Coxiellaceae bacterium]